VKFRKRPVVIEAVRVSDALDPLKQPIWLADAIDAQHVIADGMTLTIVTLEGDMTAMSDDWIIQGVKGELYPCKPDIFAATYEAVSE